LSKNAQEEDVKRFLLESENLVEPGDIHNVDAVLQVSVSANQAIYKKVKEDALMCEAMQRLMEDEINEKVAAGRAEGRAEGRVAGITAGRAEGRDSKGIQVFLNCKNRGMSNEEAQAIADISDELVKIALEQK
jgi:flagellar biosynthesis/type III secretory pathway protein FliH